MTLLLQILTLPWRARHRRRHTGAPGPVAMRSGEIIGNEVDAGGLTLYWGFGDDGSGNATSQVPIAGQGFADARVQAASVASIAALRALPFAVLAAVSPTFVVHVKSYFASGNGAGGGHFVWNAISTAADDGGSVINPTGNTGAGRYLRLLPMSVVTPEMFGAVPDIGNQQNDSTTAIQAAISTGLTVQLAGRASASDTSQYYVTSSIHCRTPGQIIRGRGRHNTYIYFDGRFSTANGVGVFVFDYANLGAGGPVLEDFAIAGYQPEITAIVPAPSGGATFVLAATVREGATTLPIANTAGLAVGQYVNAFGVPTNATITAVSLNASITISAPTTDSVYVVTVSTATLATMLGSLVQVSCIDARNTIQFCIRRMGLFVGTRAIDMRGNCGQVVIDDLHSCSFLADIDIDGALDTIRVDKHHQFPQAITARQAALAALTCIAAIQCGKGDDLKVSDGLAILCRAGLRFYTGSAATTAVNGYDSPGGVTTASVANHDFDTVPIGVDMSAGNVAIVGGYFASTKACVLAGGSLSLVGTDALAINSNGYYHNAGGNLTIVGSTQVGGEYADVNIIQQDLGSLTLIGNRFGVAANVAFASSLVSVTGGAVMALGNTAPAPAAGSTGRLFSIAADDPTSFVDAKGIHPSWANVFPANGVGHYPTTPLQAANGAAFFSAPPVTAKPAVTGAKGSNAALASLISALASYGLITDSTSA